jgi:hypothetical protein
LFVTASLSFQFQPEKVLAISDNIPGLFLHFIRISLFEIPAQKE